jgi:predicted dehydrogenase
MKFGIGIYGSNGHQIQHLLENHHKVDLVAAAAFDINSLPEKLRQNIRYYETLSAMLLDPKIDVISLCSPIRADQADDAVKCLQSGKHVYAEKPCAMTENDLDRIIKTSFETGKKFHEMAGTAFEQPYLAMGVVVKSGLIGTVVQVLAQKSYPYFDKRPQDEKIDGGLLCQAGVHAARFIEHTAGVRIKNIYAIETNLCNPKPDGGLKMAVSCIMELSNGGTASFIANYLNPSAFGVWGNETLRIFGSKGFVEAVDGGMRTRLVLNDKDMGSLDAEAPSVNYFDMFIDELDGTAEMPLSLEDELHPTRMVIKAKESGIL